MFWCSETHTNIWRPTVLMFRSKHPWLYDVREQTLNSSDVLVQKKKKKITVLWDLKINFFEKRSYLYRLSIIQLEMQREIFFLTSQTFSSIITVAIPFHIWSSYPLIQWLLKLLLQKSGLREHQKYGLKALSMLIVLKIADSDLPWVQKLQWYYNASKLESNQNGEPPCYLRRGIVIPATSKCYSQPRKCYSS